MRNLLVLIRWIGLFAATLLPILAGAHPGGLDDNGGHVDRSTGAYHCHDPEASSR